MDKPKKVLAGCLGDCVHVAGVTRFLGLADDLGYSTYFTGPATDTETFLDAIMTFDPEIIGISYRLTPENGRILLEELRELFASAGILGKKRILFGGTPPMAKIAQEFDYIDYVFSGEEPGDHIQTILRGESLHGDNPQVYPQQTIERIQWKAPFPILRHHFGLPSQTIFPTVEGITKIADASVLDVISLGADQDAQENFFRPYMQDPKSTGAGGVPFRTEHDLQQLYAASRCGNYPLLRSYSGTKDHLRYAQMLVNTIQNAWCATSLFWFNAMDGRGPSSLATSIEEHQALMHWHGSKHIPVEGNESYHWGMRDAPDTVVCASAYLYAYNAKKMGVRDYILTYMFQSPPMLSNAMDLARCLAIIELSNQFADENFRIWVQTRTGLLSYPVDIRRARAHLAQSTMLQMAVHPHIVHIVGHSEAHHAATVDEVIESAVMTQAVIETALRGNPTMTHDPRVQERKAELIEDTRLLISAIANLDNSSPDPLADPHVLSKAVAFGLLDAPQLVNNAYACGRVRTNQVNGAMLAVDINRQPIDENLRIKMSLDSSLKKSDNDSRKPSTGA